MSESTSKPIDEWCTETAIEMSKSIKERHDALPYGFQFTTRSRADNDLDSKVTKTSPMYYLGGRVETLEEVELRNDPKEKILRSNMRNNDWDRIVINDKSWRTVNPLRINDVVLDVT